MPRINSFSDIHGSPVGMVAVDCIEGSSILHTRSSGAGEVWRGIRAILCCQLSADPCRISTKTLRRSYTL